MLETLNPIVADAIARNVTPGAVVLVSDAGQICFHHAFGRLSEDGPATALDTIYDAASITKAVVTSALLMTLVAEGKIALTTKVATHLPELAGPGKEQIELRHLMGHASGLPAHVHFFDRIWAGDLAGTRDPWDALAAMAGAEPLAYETGTQTIYSDLGYILLARLIEKLTEKRLDQAFAERIAGPLGMTDSHFVDLHGQPHPDPLRIAPTGEGPRGDGGRAMVHAQVHDDNARSGGGISGHAGLFTTATDLARFAQALCDAYSDRPSFVPGEVLRRFWTTAAAPKTSWRMGFDTPSSSPGVSHSGDNWPAHGVGHLGFTGTAMWLAPTQNRFVIILTNRTYYSWEPSGIKALRRSLMHAIGDALPPL